MTQQRILVAGIGNIFLGDDAFGVEVVQRLAQRPQPAGVRVVDFGIRGFDLAFTLLEKHDLVIFVDATPRGGPPGTLYVIEPDVADLEQPEAPELLVETHDMNPLKVLRMVRSLGGEVQGIRVVGCEPAILGSEEEPAMGLSDVVRAAVDEAVLLVESLVARTLESASALATREGLFNGG